MSRNLASSSSARKLAFLGRRETYPGQIQPVELIETHFAWVFLTERHAYKMKKPLRQGVMDYRSVSSRERGCRNELRLNRRLAPTVYLGVVPLGCERDGSLVLGAGPQIVDWLVKMRRLPGTRMLDLAMAHGAVTARDRRALIDLLATFYAKARPRAMLPARYLELLRRRMDENLLALSAPDLRVSRIAVGRVVEEQQRFIDSNIKLLGARAAQLLEGHGDLRPEHVYLGSRCDASCVIDCLEFDARLRRLDPVEELAFLALECRRLGAEAFGRSVAQAVLAAMQVEIPEPLMHFYMSQRALVRAKLAAWHLRERYRPQALKHWRDRANSYIQDALHFAVLATHRARSARGSLSGRPGLRSAGSERAVAYTE